MQERKLFALVITLVNVFALALHLKNKMNHIFIHTGERPLFATAVVHILFR